MAALSITTAGVALHGTHHSSLSYLSASRPLRLPHNSVHVSRRPYNVCFNYPPSRARFSTRAAAADMDAEEGEEEGEEEEESEMTEDEITAAYEALYGPAYGGAKQQKWISGFGEEGDDETVAGKGRRRKKGMDEGGTARANRAGEGFEESVIQIRRVTKVVKGGKLMSFRAVVVIGDKMGKVGVGVGKAKEVLSAVQKSIVDAKRHLVTVPMTHSKTLPQRIDAKYGAAKVMLKPAATGTGVIAGGAVRVVLEMAGIENALGKQLGSDNPLNNARAVVEGINQIRNLREVAKARGAVVKDLWNC